MPKFLKWFGGNESEDDESVQLEKKLKALANVVHSYKPRRKDALSPQLLEFKSAITRKQEEIESEHVSLKRVIDKKLEELNSNQPLITVERWDSEIKRKIAETEEWIEEKAVLLNREFSADSDELGKHLDDVTTDLERRREQLTDEIMFQGCGQIHLMQKAFRKLDAFSSEVNRLREVAQQDAILKDLKAKVEDVIGGIQKTCEKIEKKQSVEKRKEVNGGVETMPKIPATLCGMPWNIKRTIVESLDFSPRNCLSQCSSEFKKLIDSTKIEYDRVVFSFHLNDESEESIRITIHYNDRRQLKLEFTEISSHVCEKVVNDTRDKCARHYFNFRDLTVLYLMRKINKPNVSIGQLEVHFVEGPSSRVNRMNEQFIKRMTSSLDCNRRSNPNQNKIKVKCVQVKHHGDYNFLLSFPVFVDMKTLENVILDYESPQKQEHLALVEEIIQKKLTRVMRLLSTIQQRLYV